MDLGKIDRNILKSVIKEIMMEDSSLFKEVIKEILAENQLTTLEEQVERRKRLEKMISEDFDKYDDTFNALA